MDFLISRIHNGRNVIEGQHCTASVDENGRATLTIHDVKCEDGGLYSAIAANKHGKAMSEAPVIGKSFITMHFSSSKYFIEFLLSVIGFLTHQLWK